VSPPPDDLLARLADMPAFLAAAVARVGRRCRERSATGGFSLLEHVWHLGDLEREGYAERITRLRRGERPHLADFEGDRIARERDYQGLDLADGLARFRAARTRNLEALRGLAESEWDLGGTQEGVGPVTLRDLPRMMREHDEGHRHEIEALLAELGA
jgi:DinB superfamily